MCKEPDPSGEARGKFAVGAAVRPGFCDIFAIALVAFLLPTTSFGAQSKNSETERQEYRQDFEKLGAAAKERDLKKYEESAGKILERWSGKDKEQYAQLVLKFCQPINSKLFEDGDRSKIARKYALQALKDADQLSPRTESRLIGFVTASLGTPRPTGKEWQAMRKEDATVRLRAFKRLKDAIDSKWNPRDFAQTNVVPPAETGLPPGVAPEAIGDPKLRHEYEEAIAKNKAKAEKNLQQHEARNTIADFGPKMERELIWMYSVPPADPAELKELLDSFVSDSDTRKRISDAVSRKSESQ